MMKNQVKGTLGFHRCRICAQNEISKILVVDSFDILKCNNCGFIFPSAISSDLELQDHYDSGYGDERFLCGQRVNALINVRILSKVLGKLEDLLILDVGGGYGFLAELLNSFCGTTCESVEISSRQRQYATDVLGLKVYADMREANKKYDLVISFEVLEHIPDPSLFLASLAGVLKPGGSLVLGTDNFNSPTVRRMGDLFPKWAPNEHISCFSPSSIQRLFKSVPCLSQPKVQTYLVWELRLASFARAITKLFKRAQSKAHSTTTCVMQRRYKFYNARRLLSPVVASLSLSARLNGEMMILHSRLVNRVGIHQR